MNNRNSIKQDINFLQKPLWFQNMRHDGLGFTWDDNAGYSYRTGYKPPDKVDMLILLYLMLKSQSLSFAPIIRTTRREILKSCGFPIRDNRYYLRVEESLRRWKNVAIEFTGCFYRDKRYVTVGFNVIDDYEVDKEQKSVVVNFNKKWLFQIKESQYIKYINFEYYKALKRPLSRRLHEILCKNFLNRDNWSIRVTKLGVNLTLSGRKNNKGEPVIYASDVLSAIKPAINEINKLAADSEIAKKAGIDHRDLFTLGYKITGEKQERVIHFHRYPVIIEPEQQNQKDTPKLSELFALLKHKSAKLQRVVNNYYQQKGFEYVKWNILYANKTAKKNYSTYLQKALSENWAEEWAEEQRTQIEAELARQREEQKKQDEEKKEEELRKLAKEQVLEFRQAADALDDEIKQKLWNQAEDEIPENTCRPKMNIKIRYAELVLEHLNDQGGNFVRQVLNDFGMIFDIALKKERDR